MSLGHDMRKQHQPGLPFPEWGGQREGAGRKSKGPRARVDHRPRHVFRSRRPLHITLRLARGLPSLRVPSTHEVLRRALWWGSERFGLRIVHYAALTNHVHLLAEAATSRSLSRGVRGLCVRIARALNRQWGRSGRVFEHRFHAREIRTPLEAILAIAYVLLNARRHGLNVPDIDPYSSAAWFDGWQEGTSGLADTPAWLPRPATWLLKEGWMQHGLLDPGYKPRGRSTPRRT